MTQGLALISKPFEPGPGSKGPQETGAFPQHPQTEKRNKGERGLLEKEWKV